MAVNIAINGFGRIGRLIFYQLSSDRAFEIAAINDSARGTDRNVKPELLAYLLKYETPGWSSQGAIGDSGPDFISFRGKKIKIYSETGPSKLPWKKLKVDLVLDCIGLPPSKEQAAAHLAAGAKKVLLVPAAYPGIAVDLPVIVYGINEKAISPADRIITAPSPAVSSLAPLIRALNDFAPIRSGILSAESGDKAAASGAALAAAIGRIIPELQGKLTGFPAVPEAGSSADDAGSQTIPGTAALLTAVVKGKNVTAETLNRALNAKNAPLRTQILPVTEDLYQVQILAQYGSEDAYATALVKTFKYFAELKSGVPAAAKSAAKTSTAKPAAAPKTPSTGKTPAPKIGTPKSRAQRPAGGAKPVNPALPRKPLINFPK